MERVQILDHGYLRFVEDWGHGDADRPEAGIIEAARQSTQASFRSWDGYSLCEACGAWQALGVFQDDGDGSCTENGHVWKEYPKGDMGLLSFLFSGKPQHATPFEFAGMVIEIQAPIAVFREWHRHRTQSYNEMSARYAPLPDLNYVPTAERLMMSGGKNRQAGAVKGSDELTEDAANEFRLLLAKGYEQDEWLYQRALSSGVPKELARMCLPVGRYSRMRASANLRNWLAFLTLRMDPAAQWEIRQFANVVGSIIAERFPRTWGLFAEGRARG